MIAAAQTAGRGRQGRPWWSPQGGLYLSVLVAPDAGASPLTLLPLLAGIALVDAAAAWRVAARLKWPNDVLVADRKLAGILCETSTGTRAPQVVIGIGVNLTRGRDLGPSATCIADEVGHAPDPAAAGADALLALHRAYARLWLPGARGALAAAWRERAVDWWGRQVEVGSGPSRQVGVAVGIDDDGALLLREGRGTIRVLSGEVLRLRLVGPGSTEGPP